MLQSRVCCVSEHDGAEVGELVKGGADAYGTAEILPVVYKDPAHPRHLGRVGKLFYRSKKDNEVITILVDLKEQKAIRE